MIKYAPPYPEDQISCLNRLYNGKIFRQITFQVTEDCCMACTYCYQHNKSPNKMTFEVAKKFIDKLLNDEYDFINTKIISGVIFDFIGGEPLMEIELIDQILTYTIDTMIQMKHPWLPYFTSSMCSNGLLYNTPKVQAFFEKFGHWFVGYTVSIDGNKELHDMCRVDLQGNPTYDIAINNIKAYSQKYDKQLATKMTLAPANIEYLYDATINLINEGYTEINLNCIFESGWDYSHAQIMYNHLKKVADYLIDNNLYNKIYYSLFKEDNYQPMDESDNDNWCGGCIKESSGFSIDYKGDIYPCIRYMKSSLNGKQAPLMYGNIDYGIYNNETEIYNQKLLSNLTRRSQSTDECFYCPIASGCSWCSGYNYEEFGTPNKRATYICVMHQAQSLANVYYWNKLYKKLNIDKQFIMHIPKEWALNIIDEQELQTLF